VKYANELAGGADIGALSDDDLIREF
jgi:hypothetical protein